MASLTSKSYTALRLGSSFPRSNYEAPGVRACRIARRVGVADRYARGSRAAAAARESLLSTV